MKGKLTSSLIIFLIILLSTPVLTLANEIRNRIYISDYHTSYYSDGTYSGYLGSYLYSGTYTPSDSKQVSSSVYGSSTHTATCTQTSGGTMKWDNYQQTNTNWGQTMSYNDGEYSGTLYRGDTSLVNIDRYGGSCSSKADIGNGLYDVHNYRANFSGTVTKPAVDTRVYRYRGWVEAAVSDPGGTYPHIGATIGSADGRAYWELRRTSQDTASQLFAMTDFRINGTHYATRNPMHWLNLGSFSREQITAITRLTDAADLKGTNFNYSFTYQYTNYYREVYSCTDARNGTCYAWVYQGQQPAWDLAQTFNLSSSIPIDHSQQETVKASSMEEILEYQWIVGREDTWNPSKTSEDYYEKLRLADDNDRKSKYDLKTQSWLPITPGKWIYELELPSDGHRAGNYNPLRQGGSSGSFYPVDIDSNLKADYMN